MTGSYWTERMQEPEGRYAVGARPPNSPSSARDRYAGAKDLYKAMGEVPLQPEPGLLDPADVAEWTAFALRTFPETDQIVNHLWTPEEADLFLRGGIRHAVGFEKAWLYSMKMRAGAWSPELGTYTERDPQAPEWLRTVTVPYADVTLYEDGLVSNGHHRLTALWLSNRSQVITTTRFSNEAAVSGALARRSRVPAYCGIPLALRPPKYGGSGDQGPRTGEQR